MYSHVCPPLLPTLLMQPCGRDGDAIIQATFVAASPSDLLWLDQSDLIAAMDEYPEMRECLEKTATTDRSVSRWERERLYNMLFLGVAYQDLPRFGTDRSTQSLSEWFQSTLNWSTICVHTLCTLPRCYCHLFGEKVFCAVLWRHACRCLPGSIFLT